MIIWLPNSPENSSFVLNCLGMDDVIFFEFDYFTPGGHDRKKSYCNFDNNLIKYTCHGYLILLGLVASNILEIFLTSAVMIEMKKSTRSAGSMLSKNALAERKRYKIFQVIQEEWYRYSLKSPQKILNLLSNSE